MTDIDSDDLTEKFDKPTLDNNKLNERCKALERQTAQLAAQVPFGLHQLDSNGTYVSVNAQELFWLGYTKQELIGRTRFIDLLTNESRQVFLTSLEKCTSKQLLEVTSITVMGKNAQLLTYSLYTKALQDKTGDILGYQCALFATSDRSLIEQQLQIAATVFESIEGMMVTDDQNKILKVNSAFTKITGYKAEEVIGRSPNLLSSGLHDKHFFLKMWQSILDQGHWKGEVLNRHKDGKVFPEFLSISTVKNSDGIPVNYVGIFSDATDSRNAQNKLEQLAFYDPLTGLPNRRLLIDQLQHAIDSSKRTLNEIAVLFIDLDEFKDVNNTLGHDVGDQLLVQVASRMRQSIRKVDHIARLGGDEFVIVLEDLSRDPIHAAVQVETICEKILSKFEDVFSISEHEIHNSISIGAALSHGGEDDIEELLKKADIAMYQAKKAGRSRLVFFDRHMQDEVNHRASLTGDLHKAILNQQFEMYYQIQVNESGDTTGVESLIRWNHPERGLLSPNQFIPLAEESNLIILIGDWVLKTACIQLKKWQANPTTQNLVLSVNVSPRQFKQSNFVEHLESLVYEYDIDPRSVKLEITENMLLDDIEVVMNNINCLKLGGFKFSLDDFGTGYSSLKYLQRLPLDQIKIDMSFVRNIESNLNDQGIVATIIAMVSELNLQVIAEGVENENQRAILLSKGCKNFQGYLFSQPVPITEFESLLRDRPVRSEP